jgi:Asp/Glu/hydantoin racemase
MHDAMQRKLALIHTSAVFLTVETMMRDMYREIMPDVHLINIMDDSLLATVMAEQRISPAVTRRMCAYVEAAAIAGADAVLSLCSSLGPTIDVARELVDIPVIKIDDAHTEKAAREASRIGVMATVQTTLQPTVDLIQEKAAAIDKTVEIHQSLSSAAFEALMGGEKDRHDTMVIDAARKLAPQVDVILFAQASMARLAPRVEQETGLSVLTSPRLAIEYTKRVLDGLREKDQPGA